MPELSRFLGLLIKIQYRDHAPPHIHVWYGGRDRAIVSIADGSILEGSLPRPHVFHVGSWVYQHGGELRDAWERVSRDLKPRKIAPL
jgi:hypothetical protein